MDDKNIYDSTIYVDYTDLPKQKQKELYKEYLATDKNEKQFSKWLILTPAIFGGGILALIIAALVVYFTQRLSLPFIILIIAIAAALFCFIIVNIRMDKARVLHELRFADWLKTEKHVLAELKKKA